MAVSAHRPCLSRLSATVSRDMTHDGYARGGRRAVPPGRLHRLAVSLRCLTYTVQPAWPALPAWYPVRVRLCRVLLGQWPSLHDLLRPSLACVRPLRWYYATVRLPMAVHVGLIAHRLLPPSRPLPAAENHRVSR